MLPSRICNSAARTTYSTENETSTNTPKTTIRVNSYVAKTLVFGMTLASQLPAASANNLHAEAAMITFGVVIGGFVVAAVCGCIIGKICNCFSNRVGQSQLQPV